MAPPASSPATRTIHPAAATQGKMERLWQALKSYLATGTATTIAEPRQRLSLRLLHLGIGIGTGRTHTRTEIICLIRNNEANITTRDIGEILAEFTLDPTLNHQRKNG